MDDKVKFIKVRGIPVYIHRKPHLNKDKHEIVRGKGGHLDVKCCHKELDLEKIKKQVLYILENEEKIARELESRFRQRHN